MCIYVLRNVHACVHVCVWLYKFVYNTQVYIYICTDLCISVYIHMK